MARRRETPPVVRPTGLGRVVELCKDVLIVALSCSAVFLTLQTPIATQVRGWIAPPRKETGTLVHQPSEAVEPYGVAVRSDMGLYGALYDKEQVEPAFEQMAPLFGEALSTAGQGERISAEDWRELLELPGLFCAFQSPVPRAVLTQWLGQVSETGFWGRDVSTLVLSWNGERTLLGWQEGEAWYRAETGVAYEGRFKNTLDAFSPNGAAFAYALARTDDTYETLDPYTLVSMTAPQPLVYTAVYPNFAGDPETLALLLDALGFQAGSSGYEASGEVAINEGGDSLRVSGDGRINFHAGEDVRYPIVGEETRLTAQEAATAAWELLGRVSAPWKGETDFVLTGVEQNQNGWTVTFASRLGGIPVSTGSEGWCARFVAEDKRISEFTLFLRSYTTDGTARAVTSQRLAAAALRSLPGSGGQLMLTYSDNRSGTLAAGWVAREQ